MTVVMCIIAILTLLAVSAFIGTRNQALAADGAEKVLSAIREAQNRAMSVKNGNGTPSYYTTKAWGVEFNRNPNEVRLVFINAGTVPSSLQPLSAQETLQISPGTIITTELSNNGTYTTDSGMRYISFSSPFGKSYASRFPCDDILSSCSWKESNNVSKDWYIYPNNYNDFYQTSNKIRITVDYKDSKETIIVNGKGDSYIE